jgi:hypothetical protein
MTPKAPRAGFTETPSASESLARSGAVPVDVIKESVPKKPKDLVLVHGPAPDGNGVSVLRAREERLEIGVMRPLEEGRPIHGEVVKLKQRPELPNLYDAETQYAAPEANAAASDRATPELAERGTTAGPAQVASDTYRRNWDTIWKRTPKPRLAN